MDIHELRVNSTVWYNDKRVKITAIDNTDDEPFVKTSFRDDKWLHAKLIDPIPITEELLKELGFDKSETKQYDWYKHIDDFSIFIRIFKRGRCRAEVYSEFSHHGNMVCYYLHELENFVYLTTKKELI